MVAPGIKLYRCQGEQLVKMLGTLSQVMRQTVLNNIYEFKIKTK